jgi:hypothetical protein
LEAVGAAFKMIVSWSVEGGQPGDEIIHSKMMFPPLPTVTVAAGLFNALMLAFPLTTCHEPVPLVGVLAESTTTSPGHAEKSLPARAGVTPGLTLTITSSRNEPGQIPTKKLVVVFRTGVLKFSPVPNRLPPTAASYHPITAAVGKVPCITAVSVVPELAHTLASGASISKKG